MQVRPDFARRPPPPRTPPQHADASVDLGREQLTIATLKMASGVRYRPTRAQATRPAAAEGQEEGCFGGPPLLDESAAGRGAGARVHAVGRSARYDEVIHADTHSPRTDLFGSSKT